MEKIIKGETAFEKFVLLADNTLSRGDCIIEIGEISLEDKMIDRYDSSESSTRYFEIGNKENVIEKISQPWQDTSNQNLSNETSSFSEVTENELLTTEISQSVEVKENKSTQNMSEVSEKENANIEISPKDQDKEQAESAEFNPDEIIEISEDENSTSTPVSTSNTDQKDQDKT